VAAQTSPSPKRKLTDAYQQTASAELRPCQVTPRSHDPVIRGEPRPPARHEKAHRKAHSRMNRPHRVPRTGSLWRVRLHPSPLGRGFARMSHPRSRRVAARGRKPLGAAKELHPDRISARHRSQFREPAAVEPPADDCLRPVPASAVELGVMLFAGW